jgi:hypothetical protein
MTAAHAFAESRFGGEKRLPLTAADVDVWERLRRMDEAEARGDRTAHPAPDGACPSLETNTYRSLCELSFGGNINASA